MFKRVFPHPVLSFVLFWVWLLLTNDFSLGDVVLAAALAIVIPQVTSVYWPGNPRIRNAPAVAAYLLVVMKDIVISNIEVARLILFRRGDTLKSRYITVPLDLRSAEGIAVLAGTITLTPGTVSADLSSDGRALLVHCLETTDPDATVAQIKSRYESRLKEIFE